MLPLFVNGRFARQRMTGVQRVAHEVVRALDRRLLAGQPTPEIRLLLPPDTPAPPLRRLPTTVVPGPRVGHAWEQWSLPRAARGGCLVNLSGAAPAWPRGPQACVIHDAAVFDWPQAYTPAFRRWYRWLFARQVRLGSRLLTVSAFSRQRLAAALGVAESRFALLPLGGDHLDAVEPDRTVLTRWGLVDRPFLLAVGSANPSKNLAALVRAWSRLDRPHARLVLVGGHHGGVFAGEPAAEASGVIRLGPAGDRELKALYGAARGLVFPSLYEGFGLPPLEAMACGCPVAAARAASMPEVCGDAVRWFDPSDDQSIAEAMRALWDDAVLRDELRVRGRAQVSRFRWDTTAERLLQALERP
jgi:glycosyltransferase involved in cell wall biosynthesis